MKKGIYLSVSVILVCGIVLLSCKRDKGVFPTKPSSSNYTADLAYTSALLPVIKDADAILAAVQAHNYKVVTVSPVEQTYEYGIARFASATGNFTSLLNADSVWVDTSNLNKSGSFSYMSNFGPGSPYSTYTLNFSLPVTWKVKGSGGIPAGVYTYTPVGDPTYYGNPNASGLNNPSAPENWTNFTPTYPRVLNKPTRPPHITHADSVAFPAAYTKYKSDSTKFKTDSLYNATPVYSFSLKHFVVNTDTVFITMSDGQGFTYVRKALPTDSLASFRPNDFAGYPSYNLPTFTIQMNLVKYSSQIVGGKKYYLIKIGSYIRYFQSS